MIWFNSNSIPSSTKLIIISQLIFINWWQPGNKSEHKQHLNDSINYRSEKNTAASKWILRDISNYVNRTVKTSDLIEYYEWESLSHFAADSDSEHLNSTFKNCHQSV